MKSKNLTGKIIRARPKYLKLEHFDEVNNSLINNEKEFFFNSGRAGLLFLLKLLQNKKKKKLQIGIQSFNCDSVIIAALQAGCEIILFDIKLGDYSLSYNDLVSVKNKPDVILLTHYQGIPNFEYKKIIEYCTKHNIVLIDDIAQTEGSSIDNVPIGTISDFALRSFAFDKPVTSLNGGSITVNINHYISKKEFKDLYEELPSEKENRAIKDLEALRFQFINTTPENYHESLNYYELIRYFCYIGINKKMIRDIISLQVVSILRKYSYKLYFMMRPKLDFRIKIKKLHPNKLNLLFQQRNCLVPYNKEIDALETFLIRNGVQIKQIPQKIKINWNRYSILNVNDKVKELLSENNIEASNFNWPFPLHNRYGKMKNVKMASSLDKSEFVSKNITNIPIWSGIFQNL